MRDTYKRIVKLQYKIPDQLTPAGKRLLKPSMEEVIQKFTSIIKHVT